MAFDTSTSTIVSDRVQNYQTRLSTPPPRVIDMTPKLPGSSAERYKPSALSFWQNRESQSTSTTSSSKEEKLSMPSAAGKRQVSDSSLQSIQRLSGSKGAPLIVGLDEEVEEQDRRSLEQRREETSEHDDLSGPFTTGMNFSHEDSSASTASSSRDASPWNSQSEWAKHESFVHPLDVLSTGGEEAYEYGGEEIEEMQDSSSLDGQATTEEAKEKARRRRRRLLDLKRRQGRRKLSSQGRSDAEASFTWNTSSEEEEEDDQFTTSNYAIVGPSTSLSTPASPSQSPMLESDTFYDAQPASISDTMLLSSSSLSSSQEQEDVFPEHEASWLHLSPRPQQSAKASSATLRQDAADRQHDLQHRGSSSTLLALSDQALTPVKALKKRVTLPPPRPSPNTPLPAPPTHPSRASPSSQESLPSPAETTDLMLTGGIGGQLGPSGTIRGRPRGATVGAVPGSKVEVKQRVRPRSMLYNELPLDVDALSPPPVGSTSSSSSTSNPGESSAYNGRRNSGTSYMTGSVLADGDPTSRSSFGMSGTTSSSASSSSAGLVNSSSILSSEGGGSRSRSGSNASLLQQVQYRPKSHASFVIAVVGHRGAGKSTVIKKGLRQFGLSKPNVLSEKITSHSTICIVDHEQRTIEVLEMDASVLLNGPSKRFAWPKFLPHIDAVILCYDASQIASYRGMSELLENFAINSLSTVMLACKSEILPKAVDPYYASDMAAVYNVGLAECSVQSEEGKKRMRDCFSFLVKEVAKGRAAIAKGAAPHTSTHLQNNHQNESQSSLQESLVSQESAVASSNDVRWRQSTDRKMSNSTTTSTDGLGGEGVGVGDGSLQESIQKAQMGLQSAKSAGGYVSIDELWDKLFYAAVSGNDERFLLTFMVFYRGFVQPIDLLRQVVSRFDALSRGERTDGVMIRYSLMQLTTMLGDWMQDYPGDLSGHETYPLLCDFFQRLLRHPSTMHVASPMLPLLDVVRDSQDVDAVWSKNQDSDKPRSIAADVPPVKPAATNSSNNSSTGNSEEGARSRSQSTSSSYNEAFVSMPRMLLPVEGRHRSASDVTNSSDGHPSGNSASGSSVAISSTSAATTAGSSSLVNTSIAPHPNQANATGNEQKMILRNISNALFDLKDEAIAQELTRIEWDLFSAVGSRDLLRHILVSRSIRSKESPVALSIAHFNYVSSWVCSMILVQAKTKQRARLLEKFMEIGGILRRTNNYNSLHAVLAGLGNASIHRLKNTRELLNGKPVIKTYQSLARLMGSDRSFAAYRLALENSEGRTIPYLGVHLQDILSISDGNPSKRASDGMVHWRKFNLMDEAVMAIVKCQQHQEPLKENSSISRMILDLPVMDEDTMYQRSLQVEPRQSNAGSGSAGSRMIKQFFHVDA